MKNKKRSKGDRLNWELLSEVKPIKLTPEMLIGKKVEIKEDKNRKLIVP